MAAELSAAVEVPHTLSVEDKTVADQLHTVLGSAEDAEETYPCHVGRRGRRPQSRLATRHAVEELREASAARKTPEDAVHRTRHA